MPLGESPTRRSERLIRFADDYLIKRISADADASADLGQHVRRSHVADAFAAEASVEAIRERLGQTDVRTTADTGDMSTVASCPPSCEDGLVDPHVVGCHPLGGEPLFGVEPARPPLDRGDARHRVDRLTGVVDEEGR